MLALAAIALYGVPYAIQMHRKAARIRELRSISTVEQAEKAGWGWTPGGSLLPPDCVVQVPNGGGIRGHDILDGRGKVIGTFDDCPVSGFRAGAVGPPIVFEMLLDRLNLCLSDEYGAMPCDTVAGYSRNTLKLDASRPLCVYIAGAKAPDPRVQKVADSLHKAGYQVDICGSDYHVGTGIRPPN